MSENNSLDLLPLSPSSGCDARVSSTHQDQPMLCWSVWDWLQHLTSSCDAKMGQRWCPRVFSRLWVGSGPGTCCPPRVSHSFMLKWNNHYPSRRALLCWWLKWAVLNLVQSFQVYLVLGEVTHCPVSWCLC